MSHRPSYAFGFVFDIFFCRCVTALEHEVSKCKLRKIRHNDSILNKAAELCFGSETFEYSRDWSPIGPKYMMRAKALRQVRVVGKDMDVSLESFLYKWDPYVHNIFHQPSWVIRRYLKQEAKQNWARRSIDHTVDPVAAEGWNTLMDLLADEETHKLVIGPLMSPGWSKRMLKYKYLGPLTSKEIYEQRRKLGYRHAAPRMPSSNAQPGAISEQEKYHMRRGGSRHSDGTPDLEAECPIRRPSRTVVIRCLSPR